MREIKFRAWVKEEKRMVDVENIDFSVKTIWSPIILDSIPHHFDFYEIELMQYTGLKDKNGKEIYEGDILRFKGKNYVVKYFTKYTRFALSSNSKVDKLPMTVVNWMTVEVIGNIYENSELLEEDDE